MTRATAGDATRHATGPVLELAGAGLRFGDRAVWSDIDLTLEAGEFLAVLGPNGSGKTSLLRVLLGLQELTSGRLSILGGPPGRAGARLRLALGPSGTAPHRAKCSENRSLPLPSLPRFYQGQNRRLDGLGQFRPDGQHLGQFRVGRGPW